MFWTNIIEPAGLVEVAMVAKVVDRPLCAVRRPAKLPVLPNVAAPVLLNVEFICAAPETVRVLEKVTPWVTPSVPPMVVLPKTVDPPLTVRSVPTIKLPSVLKVLVALLYKFASPPKTKEPADDVASGIKTCPLLALDVPAKVKVPPAALLP